MEFYKEIGYDGIFLTNHFLDANIGGDRTRPYAEQIEFFFADIEEGEALADEIGIKFFWGVETSYKGTDFLVYGLSKEWYLAHPEIMEVSRKEMLTMMADDGALIVHAHPFREASYIDHIRLFPRHVDGVEILNASRSEFDNNMARIYAREYGLLAFAGSDNHRGAEMSLLSGMASDEPVVSVYDFIKRVREGRMKPFLLKDGKAEMIE